MKLKLHINMHWTILSQKTILVEEYMQGEEVSVETLTVNGETL